MTPDVLLIDFGGVLTSNVFDAFGDFCAAEGLERDHFRTLLQRGDEEARRLLVAVETGAMSEPDFCAAFAPLLGPSVAADGLLDRLTATLERDEAMEEATAALRAAGVTTVMLSNSLGYGAYDGCDFDRLFDHVVISGDVGMRKPSSSIYRHALEAAGADAARAVFVDDFEHNIAAARALGLAAILHRDAAETIPRLEAAFGVELRAA